MVLTVGVLYPPSTMLPKPLPQRVAVRLDDSVCSDRESIRGSPGGYVPGQLFYLELLQPVISLGKTPVVATLKGSPKAGNAGPLRGVARSH